MEDLRKQIYGLAYRVTTYPNDFDIAFNEKGVEDLMQLIASYTAKEVEEARIDERFKAYEAIYGIHMAHDWSPMHADTKDWLGSYLKETHHMKDRLALKDKAPRGFYAKADKSGHLISPSIEEQDG